jgi:GcrA cell cycle regulator
MAWNDLRIAELTKMWSEGFSASQVARQLGGVSRSAVIGKIHRLGISARLGPARPRAPGGRPPRLARVSSSGERRKIAPGPPRPTPAAIYEVFATATVLTLTEASCRWPIGHPNQAEFGFCGRERAGKSPYCDGHAPIGLRQRDVGMKRQEIERIVRRFVEGPPPLSSLEIASEAAETLAVAR